VNEALAVKSALEQKTGTDAISSRHAVPLQPPLIDVRILRAGSRRWRSFREAAAAMGRGNALLYAAARLLGRLAGSRVRLIKYYFVAQPVPAHPPGSALLAPRQFALEWLAPESSLLARMDRPSAVIAARFAQGARCLAATTLAGELAGFLWFVPGPYEEDEVRVRFVPTPAGRVAWDFDVSVMPAYRMSRLFGYLWARAGTELRASGITHTVSRISAFNPASLAAHRRLGAVVVGQAVFLCAGSWQLMKAARPARIHLARSPGERPVLPVAVPLASQE
jgi:hypothetical protein